MFRDLSNKLSELLTSAGINPLFFLTIIAIPVYFLMYWKNLKNWEKLNGANKFFHITGLMCLFCMIAGCILEILGIL